MTEKSFQKLEKIINIGEWLTILFSGVSITIITYLIISNAITKLL